MHKQKQKQQHKHLSAGGGGGAAAGASASAGAGAAAAGDAEQERQGDSRRSLRRAEDPADKHKTMEEQMMIKRCIPLFHYAAFL